MTSGSLPRDLWPLFDETAASATLLVTMLDDINSPTSGPQPDVPRPEFREADHFAARSIGMDPVEAEQALLLESIHEPSGRPVSTNPGTRS